MKSKILVLGFALISVFAVAQSNSKTDSAKKSSDKAPAAAAVQPAMKVTPEKVEAGSESIKKVADVAPTKAKPSAADDWQARRVAAGDVNGDGKADVSSPRDAASGQASGKRQHQPVSLKNED